MDILDYKLDEIDYDTDLPKPVVKEHNGFRVAEMTYSMVVQKEEHLLSMLKTNLM